jgi:xylulokinase
VEHVPTGEIVYPLIKSGERFPFACPHARGFGLDQLDDPARRFAAGMEAVAYLERMAIEQFEQLGLPIGPTVFATGGGAASDSWLRIRASVTRREYAVPENAACAVGAAVLAATPTFGSCEQAIAAMVRCGRTIEPHPAWVAPLADSYQRFLSALRQRGYV